MGPQIPKILFVDDDSVLAKAFAEQILRFMPIEPLFVSNGVEALKTIKNHQGFFKNKIGLIFLDIRMPEMDGLQFLKEYKQRWYLSRIPVVMLTSYEDPEKWNIIVNEDAAYYLRKPPKDEALEIVTRELLSGRRKIRDYKKMMTHYGPHRIKELLEHEEESKMADYWKNWKP